VNSFQNELAGNNMARKDEVSRTEALPHSGLADMRPNDIMRGTSEKFGKGSKVLRMSSGLGEISSQSSIASSPEKKGDHDQIIGESLADQAFGGLTSLMFSEELADSVLIGGGMDPKNWTMSTKSECEEDRAIKQAVHFKKIKKATQMAVKE